MDTLECAAGPLTHEVANQPPPLVDYNVFAASAVLAETLEAFEASAARAALSDLGALAGGQEAIAWGFAANEHPPALRAFDRFGHRIDEVEFHPAYHRLVEVAVSRGLHASSWREPGPGAQVARAAGFFLWSQVDAGHGCPISMTHAAVPALRVQPDIAASWEPSIVSYVYDPGLRPRAEKRGVLLGMAMTEK